MQNGCRSAFGPGLPVSFAPQIGRKGKLCLARNQTSRVTMLKVVVAHNKSRIRHWALYEHIGRGLVRRACQDNFTAAFMNC
jgi:hypothetical protein